MLWAQKEKASLTINYDNETNSFMENSALHFSFHWYNSQNRTDHSSNCFVFLVSEFILSSRKCTDIVKKKLVVSVKGKLLLRIWKVGLISAFIKEFAILVLRKQLPLHVQKSVRAAEKKD